MDKEDLEDKILIKKSKSGDIASFKILIKKNENKIFRSAMWRVRNEADAMDIVQEVFLYAFKNINKFREKSSFSTWLNWILFDMVKRKRIKDKNHSKVVLNFENDGESEDNNIDNIKNENKKEDPQDIFISKEHSRLVLEAINSLEPKYKFPIILCDLDKLSYSDASKIINCSETTLKIRLFRARIKLKEKLLRIKNISIK